jgi:hypothetical protein
MRQATVAMAGRVPIPGGSRREGPLDEVAQLETGGDAQLGEAAVEVRADRARGEEELLADLPVGQPPGGEPDDVPLSRGKFGERVGGRLRDAEAGGPRFGPGTLDPRARAQATEALQGFGERPTRLRDAPTAPQPLGEVEQGLCAFEGPVLQYRIRQARPEVRFGVLGVRQKATGPADQRTRTRRRVVRPVRMPSARRSGRPPRGGRSAQRRPSDPRGPGRRRGSARRAVCREDPRSWPYALSWAPSAAAAAAGLFLPGGGVTRMGPVGPGRIGQVVRGGRDRVQAPSPA